MTVTRLPIPLLPTTTRREPLPRPPLATATTRPRGARGHRTVRACVLISSRCVVGKVCVVQLLMRAVRHLMHAAGGFGELVRARAGARARCGASTSRTPVVDRRSPPKSRVRPGGASANASMTLIAGRDRCVSGRREQRAALWQPMAFQSTRQCHALALQQNAHSMLITLHHFVCGGQGSRRRCRLRENVVALPRHHPGLTGPAAP